MRDRLIEIRLRERKKKQTRLSNINIFIYNIISSVMNFWSSHGDDDVKRERLMIKKRWHEIFTGISGYLKNRKFK